MQNLARTPADIGHAIKQARRNQKLTQKALATKSGVWQETISRIENGSPGTKLETLFDICAALNLEFLITERSKGNSDYLDEL